MVKEGQGVIFPSLSSQATHELQAYRVGFGQVILSPTRPLASVSICRGS